MPERHSLPVFPHQFIYFIGLRLRRYLLRIADRLLPPPVAVYDKAQGLWISGAIGTACQLDLADHLATGPKSIMELARKTRTDEDHLYRLMRTLAGEGIFKELPGKIFVNTRLSNALAESDISMKYMIMHQFGETNMTLFIHLTESIRSGKGNSKKFLGKKVFRYLQENPYNNNIYNKAMNNSSGLVAIALLSAYDFATFKTLVDVGGGQGVMLKIITEKYSRLKGILFDQAHVVNNADNIVGDLLTSGRIEVVSGDFFNDIPAGADGYFMKNILHAFGDEDCVYLLKKIHEVGADQGRLVILETITKPDNKSSFGKRLDLMMMTGTEDGKERTREEFEILLDRAGWKISRIIRTISPFSILEAVKK